MTHRLEIIDLTCARGDRPLFGGLSQQIRAGELMHVVGSNGSGKTTLLRTLCGLSQPALGEIKWQGNPIRKLGDDYRREVAYVGHQDGVQGELSALENLMVYRCLVRPGATSGAAPEAEAALERLNLAAYRSFPAKVLSQGQKRRLALARLLMAHKSLWILDEPFTALDTRSCQLVVELLAEHLAAGGLAALSSHQSFDVPGGVVRRIDLDAVRADSYSAVGWAVGDATGQSLA